jgi:hypothetical protein
MSERHDFTTFKLPLTKEDTSYHQRMGGFETKNKRTYPERKKFVSNTIKAFDDVIEPTCLSPQLINPELIYRIPSSEYNKLELNDLEGPCKFTILSTDNKGKVIVFSKKEDHSIFRERLKIYSSESGSKLDKYDKVGLPEIILPTEKIGTSLEKKPLSDQLEEADIYFWYFGYNNHTQLEIFMQKIITQIQELGGEVQNHELFLEFPLIQAKINTKILKKLIIEPTIRLIERKIKFSSDKSKFNIDIKFPVKINDPISNIGVLVLDESILIGHPLFSTSIQEHDIDPNKDLISIDHGTAVSSLVLYGDLAEILSKTEHTFTPVGKLFFASIDLQEISPKKFKHRLLYFLENHPNIKIINISLVADNFLDIDKLKQLPFGAIIDNIIHEYNQKGRDLIFVICTGNFFDYDETNLIRNTFIRNFNSLILTFAENKIKDPATSSLGLTIGSMNIGKNYSGLDLIENFLSKKFYPSLFTRIGPGVENSIKPDFVDFGSDIIKLTSTAIDERKSGIIVPIVSQYGEIGFDKGSSFSTPIFTNKIIKLWNLYPELTQNSIKCLLGIGTEIKDEMLEFLQIEKNIKTLNINAIKNILNIFGNGYFNLNSVIYSTKNFIVLLRERKMNVNKYDLFDIILPDDFFTVSGKKQLKISLTYTPPTKASRQDYLGIDLDFHLISNIDEELISKYYDLLQKNDFNEDLEEALEDIHPELLDEDFDIQNFDHNDNNQVKKFAQIISKSKEKTINCLNSSQFPENVKTRVLGKFISRNKWNKKLIPSKTLTKSSTLKIHSIKWTKRVPQSVPDENGLKILVYSKFSSSKWFETELKRSEKLDDYKFGYSIAVSIDTELDIDLRNKIRDEIEIRQRIRV